MIMDGIMVPLSLIVLLSMIALTRIRSAYTFLSTILIFSISLYSLLVELGYAEELLSARLNLGLIATLALFGIFRVRSARALFSLLIVLLLAIIYGLMG